MAAVSERGASGLPPHIWRPLADALAVALVLLVVAWALNLPRHLGLGFYPQQFFASILACTLPVAYLTLPAIRGRERETVPWFDLALAAASLAATSYIAVTYPAIVNLVFMRPPEVWVPGATSGRC